MKKITYLALTFLAISPALVWAAVNAVTEATEMGLINKLIEIVPGGDFVVIAIVVVQLLTQVCKKYKVHKQFGTLLEKVSPSLVPYSAAILNMLFSTTAAVLGLVTAGVVWQAAIVQVVLGPTIGKMSNDMKSSKESHKK
ncbi:hypothetical protein LCGC14_0147420 [marine sediment metagenome]|uniref:Uncharacterized protein n=1 Tax=marine sediment metagenome TaxID=412755 RepID=A0A0F9V081_9ZZZZ